MSAPKSDDLVAQVVTLTYNATKDRGDAEQKRMYMNTQRDIMRRLGNGGGGMHGGVVMH